MLARRATAPEQAYHGLRHFQPDAIRTLRTGFDNGLTEKKQAAHVKKIAAEFSWPDWQLEMTLAAITWMAKNPTAGRIRWTEGEAYMFIE